LKLRLSRAQRRRLGVRLRNAAIAGLAALAFALARDTSPDVPPTPETAPEAPEGTHPPAPVGRTEPDVHESLPPSASVAASVAPTLAPSPTPGDTVADVLVDALLAALQAFAAAMSRV